MQNIFTNVSMPRTIKRLRTDAIDRKFCFTVINLENLLFRSELSELSFLGGIYDIGPKETK